MITTNSPVHSIDVRVKLVLLLVYSVTLFFVEYWTGLGICAAFLLVVIAIARLSPKKMLQLCIPLFVILGIIWLCNALVFGVEVMPDGTVQSAYRASGFMQGVSAGFATGMPDVPLVGGMGISPVGCMQGLFYVVRILLIFLASFVLVFTSTSESLTEGFSSLLSPLRTFHVPVDDIATMFSLVLRFIPLAAQEMETIQIAQKSRGALFDTGSLWKRIRSWVLVFIPLFVGMFRRGDAIAQAMDARCYGMNASRSHLNELRCSAVSVVVLAAVCAMCVVVAVVL